MRRFFLIFLTVVFSISLLAGVLLFAINSSSSEMRIKSYLSETNSYSLVAGWMRDQLVKNSAIDLKEGQNLEILNETVNTDVAKILVDDSVSHFFSTVSTGKKEIVFDYSTLIDQFEASTGLKLSLLPDEGADHLFRYEVKYPLLFKIFAKFPLLELSMMAIALICAAAIILLTHSNKGRFLPIGAAFIFTSLATLIVLLGIRIYGDGIFTREMQLRDPKLIIISQRLYQAIAWGIERTLITTTIIFGVVGIALISIFRPAGRDKIELITKAIDCK